MMHRTLLCLMVVAIGCKKTDLPPPKKVEPYEQPTEVARPAPQAPAPSQPVRQPNEANPKKRPNKPGKGKPNAGKPKAGKPNAGKPAPKAPKAEPEPTPDAPVRKGTPVQNAPAGIYKVSAGEYEVSKDLFNRWKDSPTLLGYAVSDGAGWRLKNLRSGHGYHLGMRNGDVVTEINGHKLQTKTQLISAYLSLKFSKNFVVNYLRDGSPRATVVRVVRE